MFSDEVKIIERIIDNDNVVIEIKSIITRAYIENQSREIVSSNGVVVNSNFIVMLPNGIDIDESAKIEIVKMHGKDPVGSEVGEKQVKAVHRVGGFSVSHIEAYL